MLKNNVRLNLLVLKCDKNLELRKIMHYYVWFWPGPHSMNLKCRKIL